MERQISRRSVIRAGAGLAAWATMGPRPGRGAGPNEKLNIGVIGTAGRGADNLAGVQGENIVALCDIDAQNLGRAAARFPGATTCVDFRRLIELPGLDAVVISTADHTHAAAAALALRAGKHVYCEKPLTHTVAEARTISRLAAEARVATQMGTQIHASNNYRRVVEQIQAGVIGPVREVHVWLGAGKWGGGDRPVEIPAVPTHLDWDLWLGPAPSRPYHPTYLPANWRRWWDFGNGTLGDMACHFMDLPFWALGLRHPTTVAARGPKPHPETAPEWVEITYKFPTRGDQPPVTLTWTDGRGTPPAVVERGVRGFENGVLFVGSKGCLASDYSKHVLLPEVEYRDFRPPAPSIAPSIGHHAEWIAACKDGRPTTCHFDYAGALTEAVLLGVVAFRTGETLAWDAANLRVTNCSAADQYLHRAYRTGWTI